MTNVQTVLYTVQYVLRLIDLTYCDQEVVKSASALPWLVSTLEMMEVVSPASYQSSVVEDLALIPISDR